MKKFVLAMTLGAVLLLQGCAVYTPGYGHSHGHHYYHDYRGGPAAWGYRYDRGHSWGDHDRGGHGRGHR